MVSNCSGNGGVWFEREKELMRKCPRCGFEEPPIWRNTAHRLYTQHCFLTDLEEWDRELADVLRVQKYVFRDGFKYRLSPKGIVHRIEAACCRWPDPKNPSLNEPHTEKHLSRLVGREMHVQPLFPEEK
jgi:endogenous inhibitor of DNA gyrase (YacG/DUF329 family)